MVPCSSYIDDFACAPLPLGQLSTKRDCARAGRRLHFFGRLGIVLHLMKGC